MNAKIEKIEAENKRLKEQISEHSNNVCKDAARHNNDGFSDFESLIMAVIEVESRGNPNAEYEGCMGLMQIKNGTKEPVQNVISGSKMLAHLIAKSVNNADSNATPEYILHRSLTAYNRGWAGANKYKARTGKFDSAYSKKVLKKYYEFKEKNKK